MSYPYSLSTPFIDGATVSLKSVKVKNNSVDVGAAEKLFYANQMVEPGSGRLPDGQTDPKCARSAYDPAGKYNALAYNTQEGLSNKTPGSDPRCAKADIYPTPQCARSNGPVVFASSGSSYGGRSYYQDQTDSMAFIPMQVQQGGPRVPYSTMIGGAVLPRTYPYYNGMPTNDLAEASNNVQIITYGSFKGYQ